MADYLITADNKDQWSVALPELLKTQCNEELNPAEWYGYVMGYSDSTWSRKSVTGSTMSAPYNTNINMGVPVFDIDNANIDRFCGYLGSDSTDNDTPITITIEDGYITNNEQIYIHLNEYGNIKKLQNVNAGFNTSTTSTPQSVEELGSYSMITGTGSQKRLNIHAGGRYADLFCLDSNIPIFDTRTHAIAYIQSGTKVGLLNGKAEDKRPTQYYFEEDIFRLDMAYSNKSQVARIRNYYDTNKENTRLVRYTEENADGYNNVVILGSSRLDNPIIQCRHTPNGTPTDYTLMVFNALNNEWNRKGVDGEITYNNHIYKGNIRTNIPYASSREQAEKYLRNEISINDLPKYKQTGLDVYKREWTGDRADAQDTDISEHIYADGNLVSQYIMTSNQLDNVKDLIYTTETDTLNALKLALSSHGETFISDIIDCYHVPINVEGFVGSTSVSHVPFGLYESDCSGKKVTTHGKIIELGSVSINGQYGDFRDYECVEMALYLPFCGIMPLPTDVFMNSVLTIKVGADLRAHNLRYYIFVNNESGTSLYSFHDCAFGQNICLMGNDSGSRALTTMQTAFNIQNTQRNLTYNIMNASSQSMQGATNQFMHGNVGGSALSLLNGGTRIAQEIGNAKASVSEAKLTQKMTQAQRIFSGSQSSGLSENDILYPYLLFTIQNTNYDGVVDLYGKPSNYFGLLSNCKGFTQCDDVRINMNIPINEKQMLIDALKEGVIL